MFRALLCQSSGARDYGVDYHIGRFVVDSTVAGVRVAGSSTTRVVLEPGTRTQLQPNRT